MNHSQTTENRSGQHTVSNNEQFNRVVLDSLPAHVAVLDKTGTIISINEAWKRFARETGDQALHSVGVGTNYLAVCCQIEGEDAEVAQAAVAGIQAVLTGSQTDFILEYPCHSPTEMRWFLMRVTPLTYENGGAVIAHIDISERVLAESEKDHLYEAVSQQREQLRVLTGQLAEAQETERKALARELHDQVGQNLTVLNLNLKNIQTQLSRLIPEIPNPIETLLQDSLSLVEQTTERIQDVMADLRPPVLDDYGLVAALRWYCKQLAPRISFRIAVNGEEPEPRLPAPVEHTLFRIVQEALTNVMKHANARRVEVRLETDNEFAHLVVADDGLGFDLSRCATPTERESWGLLTMIERIEAVGGYCQIESQPGQGTRIIVEAPRYY